MFAVSDSLKLARALLFGASLVMMQLASAQGQPREYEFGVIGTFTGIQSSMGEITRGGIEMAVEEINAKGGVGGIRLKPVYGDFGDNKVQLAVSAMQKMVSIDKVPYVISWTTPAVAGIAPIATDNKVVVVNIGGISPTLVGVSPFVFHNIPNGVIEAEVMANYMYRDKGIRKVALFSLKDAFGLGVMEAFKKHFVALGGTIVGEEGFTQRGTALFTSQVNKITSWKPDAVYENVGAGPDNALFIKQLRQAGFSGPVFGSSAYNAPENFTIGAGFTEGDTFTQALFPVPGNDRSTGYAARYKAKYAMESNTYSANAYDAVYILAGALKYAKDNALPYNGDSLRRAILQLEFDGITGRIKFKEDGTAPKPLSLNVVKDKKSEVLGIYDLSTTKLVPAK